jgi:hypothetical protein
MTSDPLLDDAELARVLRLYEGPAEPSIAPKRSHRRLAVASITVAIAGAATAAIVALVSSGPKDRTHAALAPEPCTSTLVLASRTYIQRDVPRGVAPGARRLGDGIFRRCGSAAAKVTVTTLAGVDASRAVAVRGRRQLVYVARECVDAPAGGLAACLRKPQ